MSIPRIGFVHRTCAENEKCTFCLNEVFLNSEVMGEAIVIKNIGICHTGCAEKDLALKQAFGSSTRLQKVTLGKLYELKELLQIEINHREGMNSAPELF